MSKKDVYSITITGLMTEAQARTIANVAQAVMVTAGVSVSAGTKVPMEFLKPKTVEVERF